MSPCPRCEEPPGKRLPRRCGDVPESHQGQRPPGKVAPPTRAVGRIFEITISLPEPANGGGRPPGRGKPSRKPKGTRSASKPRAKAAPKGKQPKRRHELSPTEVEAKSAERLEFDRRRRNTPERRDYHRLHAQEQRRKAKELGICRDCRAPAIPDQTRCETCAARHRLSRRKWQTERRERDAQK